tara:strand:- start:1009 stop:1317 length:309 start_codon:yes stop_codon:yes gene_type:complete
MKMQKRLFDRDPQLGITKYWHVKDNGEYVVETVQDVTGIAEYNKRSYNNTDKKWNDLNKVASIPLSVYYDLKRKGIADDPVALKKWMNDSDNQVFRTRQGRL